jgi:hypothetical protein
MMPIEIVSAPQPRRRRPGRTGRPGDGAPQKELRLALKDDREFVGPFTGFGKFRNFVLTEAEEFFRSQMGNIW